MPEEASAEIRRVCSNLAGARKIEFDRCILPVEFIYNPQLITFVDGSTQAMCAIIYIRWKIQEDVFQSFLVCAKTKVALKTAMTVPRTELVSTQIGIRLAATVEKSMSDLVLEDNIYLTDSSAVFDMLRAESSSPSTFTGHRISEVRAATEEAHWMWVPTKHNTADLGTWTGAKPEDLEEVQHGYVSQKNLADQSRL